MTLDVSLEAIKAELAMASRGGQVADLAVRRAQVLATLLAAGGGPSPRMVLPEALVTPTPPVQAVAGAGVDIEVGEGLDVVVYTVPNAASWEDRVTAAAMLLKVPEADLVAALEHLGELTPGFAPVPDEALQRQTDLVVAHQVEEGEEPDDDVDADFFAEAKKARRKK